MINDREDNMHSTLQETALNTIHVSEENCGTALNIWLMWKHMENRQNSPQICYINAVNNDRQWLAYKILPSKMVYNLRKHTHTHQSNYHQLHSYNYTDHGNTKQYTMMNGIKQ
jgi:hypothetical protein